MKNNIRFHKDGHCLYLVQDLEGLDLYERVIAIDNFKNRETKLFERLIDNEIIKIFRANGINVYDTSESALNELFSALNSKGKRIEITDLFECKVDDNCVLLGKSPNRMTVWLEDETLLECGIRIREIEV